MTPEDSLTALWEANEISGHAYTRLTSERGRLLAALDRARAERDALREYWEASQAVQGGIIDFDLHGAQVDRLEAATEAVHAVAGGTNPE